MPQKDFFVLYNGRYKRVKAHDVFLIEAAGNFCKLITAQASYLIKRSLNELENRVDFCRVHRKYIVSLDKVEDFTRSLIRLHDREIPISKHYWNNLARHFELP